MYRLWWLLPILEIWLFFFIGHKLIVVDPSSVWWGFPLLSTMAICIIFSFGIAAEKGT